jgi:hypothetical protein
VFSRDQLARCIWHCEIRGRTVDSHVARLRTRLISAGAGAVLVNKCAGLVADDPALTATQETPVSSKPGTHAINLSAPQELLGHA